MKYKMLDGNAAAVEAIKMARVQLVSAYPITPQSAIAETLSELVDSGELDAEYVRVESEHTALSCALGAQLTGIRTATATSSVGLALMHEIVNVVSGCRVPIVMPIVNRSLAAPWSLWCDHQDSMSERDSGWIQIYCEDVQDVFDSVVMAYRIGEHPEVLLPVMVCIDGFFLSHSMRKVSLPEQSDVDEFIGPYSVENLKLDPDDPMVVDNLTGSHDNTEIRYQQTVAFERAKTVMQQVFDEYGERFGRHKKLVETYRAADAEAVIVCLGSMAGTVKHVVDQMRAQGHKVGLVKPVSFRPFPSDELREALAGAGKIAVLERTASYGGQGTPLWVETCAALQGGKTVKNYIAGLAGRDIHTRTIEKVFLDILASNGPGGAPVWIDCDTENAMTVREVIRRA